MTTSYEAILRGEEAATPLTLAAAKRLHDGDLGPVRGQSLFGAALDIVAANRPELVQQHLEIQDWRGGSLPFEALSVASQIFCQREKENTDLAGRWNDANEAEFSDAIEAGETYEAASAKLQAAEAMQAKVVGEVDAFVESVSLPKAAKFESLEAWLVVAARLNPTLTPDEVYRLASKEAPPELISEYLQRHDQKPEQHDKPSKPKVALGDAKKAAAEMRQPAKPEKHSAETFGYWRFDGDALVDNMGVPLAVSDTGLVWDAGLARWRTRESMVADWEREHSGGG